MKQLEQKVEARQTYFKVEAEPAEVAAALEKAYQKLAQQVEIDGFRKGKAPRELLERKVGKERLFDEAMEDFLPRSVVQLVQDNKVPVYGRPQVRIVEKEPLVFEVRIPMPPEVKLGDYNTIKMKPEPVSITDEAVDKIMERLRKQGASWEVAERPLQVGDASNLDIESTLDGKPFINEKGSAFQLIAGMNYPAPGFTQELVGLSKGEEKQFTLKLPEEYGDKNLAGKEVAFKVKVNEVRGEKLPEVNEEFSKSVQPGFPTPQAL
ncbi:MAG TPA: trigger factor, partial [bacterium]|nr:trigger factor [bacterium]